MSGTYAPHGRYFCFRIKVVPRVASKLPALCTGFFLCKGRGVFLFLNPAKNSSLLDSRGVIMLAHIKIDLYPSEEGIKHEVYKRKYLVLAWHACHTPPKKGGGSHVSARAGGSSCGNLQNHHCAQCSKDILTPWKIVDQLSFCSSLCYDRYLGLV